MSPNDARHELPVRVGEGVTDGPTKPTCTDQAPSSPTDRANDARALHNRRPSSERSGRCLSSHIEAAPYSTAQQPAQSAVEPHNTEFEHEYPPDPIGGERDESATVWEVYRDEATAHDTAMLDNLNKTIDVLLIFAGLFSAIVTAFLVDSYHSLEPDFTEYTARALYALLLRDRSADSLSAIGVLPPAAPSQLTPSTSARFINGMWCTSLLLSLASAFLSILVKQWLEDYRRRTLTSARSPRHWARRRALCFDGFERWHIHDLVAALPLCLHVSMFLFVSGLVLILWDLDRSNSMWLLALTALIFLFYSACTVAPLLSPGSPLATPLSYGIRRIALSVPHIFTTMLRPLTSGYSAITGLVRRLQSVATPLRRMMPERPHVRTFDLETQHAGMWRRAPALSFLVRRLTRHISRLAMAWAAFTRRRNLDLGMESQLAYPASPDILDARALKWIITTSISVESVSIASQAIAAFSPWSPALDILRQRDCSILVRSSWKARYDACRAFSRDWDVPYYHVSPQDVGRDLRSAICLYGPRGMAILLADCAPALLRSVQQSSDYDVQFIIDAANADTDSAAASRFASEVDAKDFHASTALLVLQFHMPICHRLQLLMCLFEWGLSNEALLQTTQSGRLGASCNWESQHLLSQCTLHCSIELLSSEIISEGTTTRTTTSARTVLSHLISHLNPAHVMPLADSKLLQLLAASTRGRWAYVDLEQALLFMASLVKSLTLSPRRCTPLPAGWRSVWGSAIAFALDTAILLSDEEAEDIASRVVTIISGVFSLDAENVSPVYETSDFATQLLSRTFAEKRSSWELLNAILSTSVGELFVVADLIVGSLSNAAHDPVLVDHFFSTSIEFHRRLLRAESQNDTEANTQGINIRFLRFANRCSQIRPSWPRMAVLLNGVQMYEDSELLQAVQKVELHIAHHTRTPRLPETNVGGFRCDLQGSS